MKKMLAFLLAATMSLGLLAGCGKSASPYLPYSDTIRLDTPKDELIAAEGLVVDELATENREDTSEPDTTYYTKPGELSPAMAGFSSSYTFKGDKLYAFYGSLPAYPEHFEFTYGIYVKSFNNLYGTGKEITENPRPGFYSTYQGTYWEFEIDTGAQYRLTLQALTTDTLGGEVRVRLELLEE